MKRLTILMAVLMMTLGTMAKDQYSYNFQRAEEAYQNKDLQTALYYCKAGISDNEKDGYCWAVLAEICSKRDIARYGEALEACDKALTFLPKKDAYWVSFVWAIRGDVYFKVDDLEHSYEAYKKSLQIDPNDKNVIYSMADVCSNLKKYEEAIGWWEKLEQTEPGESALYICKGRDYMELGKADKARQAWQMAMTLDPKQTATVHAYQARMARRNGNYLQAIGEVNQSWSASVTYMGVAELDSLYHICPQTVGTFLDKYLLANPNSEDAWSAVGYFYESVMNAQQTLYCYRKQQELSAQPQSCNPSVARGYQLMGEYEKAILLTEETLKTDSTDADRYQFLGHCAQEAGLYAEAERYYRKSLELSPEETFAYRMIARTYSYRHMYDKAMEELQTALATEKGDQRAVVYLNLGELQEAMGQHAEAEQSWRQCLQFESKDTTNTDYSVTFALAYAHLGKRAEAISKMERKIRKDDHSIDYEDLAYVYDILSETDNVTKALQTSFEKGNRCVGEYLRTERLANSRKSQEFNAFLTHWDEVRKAELAEIEAMLRPADDSHSTTEIPFTRTGGVCQVRCTINGLPLYFVFDTGAADVSLSSVEANFMLKNGYLSEQDFVGTAHYVNASGEVSEGAVINLHEVRVGDIVLTDVKASVSKSQRAPLLLGQSVFQRFGTMEIDNEKAIIRFNK